MLKRFKKGHSAARQLFLDQRSPPTPTSSQHMSSSATRGLYPPWPPAVDSPTGASSQGARKHGDGMQGAVGTQPPAPRVACVPVPLNPVS